MNLKDFLVSSVSFFKQDLKTKDEVINFLSQKLVDKKFVSDISDFKAKIQNRESQDSTGIGDSIAIPHAITNSVTKSVIAFISLTNPIEWNSIDGKPVDLVFMIATNDEAGEEHLTAISNLSTILMNSNKQKNIRSATNFEELIINFETEPVAQIDKNNDNGSYDLVGITACPTGIAHTYLAAEKMIEAAKEMGMTVKVETQGRRGTENKLTKSDIDNAKVIILAHDKALDGMERFVGKTVIDTNTKDIIFNGSKLIQKYKNNEQTIKIKENVNNDFSLKKFKDFKGNLLAGVSRMLPFVVAGGIILGIGFLIDFIAGNGNAAGDFGTVNAAAGWFSAIGKTAMMMMVPILAGYIAYTIVGPQGLMPGIVAGVLADGTGGFAYGSKEGWSGLWTRLIPNDIPMTSGFIGGMVGAYFAAFIVYGLSIGFKRFSKPFQGIRDIVLIPIVSLLGISLTMFIINIPLGYTMYGIQEGLTFLANKNLLVLLGAIIAMMMCIDMGGPINKIAYVLGTMSVGGQLGSDPMITNVMAASMAGGMIPPLGIALCAVIFKNVWTAKERDEAKANWLMGAFFITEGAIPFMITDMKKISTSAIAGGTVTGLLVGAFKITLNAPHGGIATFPLLNSHLFESASMMKGMGVALYIVAIITGVVLMSLILGFWKLADIKNGKLIIESGITKKSKLANK